MWRRAGSGSVRPLCTTNKWSRVELQTTNFRETMLWRIIEFLTYSVSRRCGVQELATFRLPHHDGFHDFPPEESSNNQFYIGTTNVSIWYYWLLVWCWSKCCHIDVHWMQFMFKLQLRVKYWEWTQVRKSERLMQKASILFICTSGLSLSASYGWWGRVINNKVQVKSQWRTA